MSLHFQDWDERTFDLALARFTTGVEPDDEARLEGSTEPEDLEDLEHVLAAIHVGSLDALEEPPRDLMARLEQRGRRLLSEIAPPARRATPDPPPPAAPASAPASPPSRALPPVVAWTGWLAAAALLVFVLVDRGGTAGDPFLQRQELLSSVDDVVRVEWSATEDEAAAGAEGDVVWSPSRQRGYMRFRGLEPNDPTTNQYQLWIFDPTRADWEAKPVDGGVFDVSSDGEVVVPIDAKLRVGDTALFAVTVEEPGGVVVSERERIVLTAQP